MRSVSIRTPQRLVAKVTLPQCVIGLVRQILRVFQWKAKRQNRAPNWSTICLDWRGDALMSACAAASPINYVGHSKHVPPILIMHGKADKLVVIKQSEMLVDKMKSAGITNVKLVELNGGHGYPGFGSGTILDVIKFFQDKLQK